MDWDLVRIFVAVANAPSISEAARDLGMTQPTLSRRLVQLEDSLDVPLVIRSPRGIELTDRGAELVVSAQVVAEQMDQFERLAAGSRTELRGTVRLAATEVVGVAVLAPILAEARRELPNIALELVLDNRTADLLRGDADIAARMYPPEQADLFGRKLGELPVAMYASRDYVARRGEPTLSTMPDHDLIGFDSRGVFANMYTNYDDRLTPDIFAFRTDSLMSQLELCRHGGGVAGLQVEIASRFPELIRVVRDAPIPPMPLWLVMHRDVRGGAHVRAVYNRIADELVRYIDSIESA